MQTYRLINIVMMLLAQDTISAQTFADLFQVTKRTILRDMDHLSAAHIPVVATRGVNGGFRLLDTYKIDKRLLSVKDLQNILAAVQGLDALLVDPDVAMTLTKVSGLLPTTKKTAVSPSTSMEHRIYLLSCKPCNKRSDRITSSPLTITIAMGWQRAVWLNRINYCGATPAGIWWGMRRSARPFARFGCRA